MTQHQSGALDRQVLIVRAVADEANGIRSYELATEDGAALPAYEPGAHVAVHLENGITRQYSLYEAAGLRKTYRIAVLKDPASRGGSRFLHEQVGVGERVRISGPYNHFPMTAGATSSLLIAGGIGITPILSMAARLFSEGQPFALHYCARREQDAAFVDLLRCGVPFAAHVHLHFDGGDPGKGLDVRSLLSGVTEGRHLYCCGPGGLMNAVEAAASHWPAGTVHFERFAAETADAAENTAFRIHLCKSGLDLDVPADKSVLQVLKHAGFDISTVCEQGVCGACLTDVVDGVPEHRDQILTDDEKRANDVMAVCCSRSRSPRLVLDL
ncbi:ferredoxin [Burkholderia lata]|uniref:PDR/VanB family oxidoreductase n=1 Tax=Burkholderia lata (strain ATCC 17760 / DSM 23089 / LMG 22485 / NCIMB 9086 / R18194 / 383) TaxID=482957 RepID=UPI001452EBE9|nr:PDR/VanB family oxidoreductase [Burkholderia lata]VWB06162.1 ferredoxin [Burkholderia lata]